MKVLIQEDGSIKILGKKKKEAMNFLHNFFSAPPFPMISALCAEPLVQGQVIGTDCDFLPFKMTITEITEENVYVDIELFSCEDDDDEDDDDDEEDSGGCDSSYLNLITGKGVWKRDNALVYDIKLEVQFMSEEDSFNTRFRSVSKQN